MNVFRGMRLSIFLLTPALALYLNWSQVSKQVLANPARHEAEFRNEGIFEHEPAQNAGKMPTLPNQGRLAGRSYLFFY
ncbi:MAG: hypothetical protein HYV06_07185 [Deltaproteobacteria bacterium]|nr:hypothetical protein [Deltaproteobacteria bacterium]